MRVKPFVRFINFNHIMPTRYNLDVSVASRGPRGGWLAPLARRSPPPSTRSVAHPHLPPTPPPFLTRRCRRSWRS